MTRRRPYFDRYTVPMSPHNPATIFDAAAFPRLRRWVLVASIALLWLGVGVASVFTSLVLWLGEPFVRYIFYGG